MSPVVADTSFLLALHVLNLLGLARTVFGEILIPPAVLREATVEGKPGANEIQTCSWIHPQVISDPLIADRLKTELGEGEAEAIALAVEIGCEVILMDDADARKRACQMGLRPFGIAGFLASAKRLGYLSSIKPMLEELLSQGFRLGPKIIQQALIDAGE